MNRDDRKRLKGIESLFDEECRAFSLRIAPITQLVRDMADAQQERFDNLPEGLQEAEVGQNLQIAVDNLTQLADELECLDPSDMVDWEIS